MLIFGIMTQLRKGRYLRMIVGPDTARHRRGLPDRRIARLTQNCIEIGRFAQSVIVSSKVNP
jgi:hypothetical protein